MADPFEQQKWTQELMEDTIKNGVPAKYKKYDDLDKYKKYRQREQKKI